MRYKLILLIIPLILIVQTLGYAQEEDANYWMQLGAQFYNQGDFRSAIICFLRVKEIQERTIGINNASYANTLNGLGTFHLSISDYSQAEKYF